MQFTNTATEAAPAQRRRRLGMLWISLLAFAAFLFIGSDARAAGGPNVINSPDSLIRAWHMSMELDGSGNPVVSYFQHEIGENLKLLHCNDPNCAGGDDSVTSPDTAGEVGEYTSLALDGAGNPVVSYYDRTNNTLKVMHCNDPDCAGGDESITSPDPGSSGAFTSLELDAAGNPVVSYFDNNNLKVLHCNDPNCAGGDESITSPGVGGNFTSLELDAAGNPVVSSGGSAVMLLHCNDPDCAGGDESITSPDTPCQCAGQSLALDGSGNPVVSYMSYLTGELKVLRCDDPNCAGGGDTVTPQDVGTNVQLESSLQLDGSGNPMVSYFGSDDSDLRILHCNDPQCTGGDESIEVPDTDIGVGHPSLVLDAAGNPIVIYHNQSDHGLKLLHCGNPNCAEPVGGVAALPDADRVAVASSATSGIGAERLAIFAAAAMALLSAGALAWYAKRR